MAEPGSIASSDQQQPVICLMGPTAAGKTGLAVELVKQFPLEIISVDSVLVYRGMDIGTAKPDAQTLAAAPHRLIDICDPTEVYSAARFSDDARQEISEINRAGKVPLLVGGTMLYYRALLEGLSKLPQANPETRARLEARAAIEGWPALHLELSKLDPEVAGRINPNDPQRIQRALEVIELTGQRMSELQSATASTEEHYQPLKLVICPDDRKVLHERIADRFQIMLDEGFVDEVRVLREIEGIHAALPSMRAVGYRQCWQWLEGALKADEWQEKAIAATRQLAKRQLTWLRREKQALWYDLSKGGSSEQVFDAVREFLNRCH